MSPDNTLRDLHELKKKSGFSGIPIMHRWGGMGGGGGERGRGGRREGGWEDREEGRREGR